jgi:flagellin
MSFSINTNLGALNAYNALAKINAQTTQAQLRLATQKKINSVADDTSGYRQGKVLEGQIAVWTSAQGNIGSAKNSLSNAESALSNINDLLNQIQAKQTDAKDPSKDKGSIANDINALGDEINSMIGAAQASGTYMTGLSSLTIDLSSVSATDSGIKSALASISSTGTAGASASNLSSLNISALVSGVQTALGKVGNYQQRLNVESDYVTSAISNATASHSQLFDADMAMEQLNATKGTIGSQIATTMLYQLNTAPQNLLSLFR